MPLHSGPFAGGLGDELRATIAIDGPISVARFMAIALGHPTRGYYATRDPFGAAGDFITAPEISQMFGELIGLWAATVWQQQGKPAPVRLVELGPGRGTLMADALRVVGVAMPAFRAAVEVHLVETSSSLRAVQERTLAGRNCTPVWHDRVDTLPEGPALILANEFFDALPIRQFVRAARGWCERQVGLEAQGQLAFGLRGEPEPALTGSGPEGSVLEICPAAQDIVADVAHRLARHGGAALVIDYGRVTSGFGDTLQAVRAHRFADPLADPGNADLTAHVDFAALARTAAQGGAAVHGPVTQGSFLQALGLSQRAAALKRNATPAQSQAIDTAVARLAGPDPGMGELFKVLAFTAADAPAPPGFGDPT